MGGFTAQPWNWQDFLKNIVLPAAGIGTAVYGATRGNAAEQQGIQASRADLEAAQNKAMGYAGNTLAATKPVADWYLGQGQAASDWAYNNSLANLGWGLQNTMGIRNEAMGNAANSLNQGFTKGQAYLQPYSTAGQQGLAKLTQHTLGGALPSYGALPTGGISGPTSMGTGIKLPTNSPYPWAGGGKTTGTSNLPTYPTAMTGNSLAAAGGMNPLQTGQANALMALEPGTGTRIGQAAAMGAGTLLTGVGTKAVSGAVAGLFPALASALPFIGLGIAAVAGPVIGLLTRKGREKVSASQMANAVGQTIENNWINTQSGQMSKDQFKTLVQAAWTDYANWLRNDLKDEDVKSKSLASQAYWINKSMAEKGINLTVSSPEGNSWIQGGNAY